MSRKPEPFISVPFARLADAAETLPDERHLPYHLAYPEFIRYFKNIETITPHNLIIGAHFTYGWMPTMLELHDDDRDSYVKAAGLLTDLKCGAPLSVETLERLIRVINNSLVGTSKLLHFLRPDRFAIWDSRVCFFIYGKYFADSWTLQCERYLFYLENCHELAADPAFPALHATICANQIGQDVPPLRAIEWIMYSAASHQAASHQ